MNRDPFYKLDSHFTIGTTNAGLSWFLNYRNRAIKDYKSNHWNMDDITDFGVTMAAITGNSPKGFFIADCATEELSFFPDVASRDEFLRSEYHQEPKDFVFKPSLLMEMKTNCLWPYVHLYYTFCLVLIPLSTITKPRVNGS